MHSLYNRARMAEFRHFWEGQTVHGFPQTMHGAGQTMHGRDFWVGEAEFSPAPSLIPKVVAKPNPKGRRQA
ncbi:hypothetical protein UFOVP351_26 [uncultured Caudovirales phage]|uniref:Uncharacterized protein n=1 Tax=uncultured Caudovirales phage TaxID=2100421 RepID=A0A6J5LYJ2_9CAUD|nr:hypothetical protein UFOVP351_26 [uncultured Caudovirales phage]